MKPTMNTAAIILTTVVMSIAGVKLFDRLSSSSTQAQIGRFTQAEHQARRVAFDKKFHYYSNKSSAAFDRESKIRDLLRDEEHNGTAAMLQSDLNDAKKDSAEYAAKAKLALRGWLNSKNWVEHGKGHEELQEMDDIDPETL